MPNFISAHETPTEGRNPASAAILICYASSTSILRVSFSSSFPRRHVAVVSIVIRYIRVLAIAAPLTNFFSHIFARFRIPRDSVFELNWIACRVLWRTYLGGRGNCDNEKTDYYASKASENSICVNSLTLPQTRNRVIN